MANAQSPDRLARSVHITLLVGLLISAALLVLGASLVLASHQPRPQGQPEGLSSLLSQAASGNGAAILNLGLLVLMFTPVARVIVLAAGWLLDRQWRFGVVALCVLCLLALSVILGTG
jgi:uncharacterized membrane protein